MSKRVLVVDDDALVLMNTVAMAEELGHYVVDAMSGEEALRVLRDQPIDLVVSDYAMPKMTGGELGATVQEKWPDVKIIITTGYAEMPGEHRGRFARLGKPFSSFDLKAAIERSMEVEMQVVE